MAKTGDARWGWRRAGWLILCALFAGAITEPTPWRDGKGKKTYESFRYPELPEFKIPTPTRVVLPNGMVILLLEDHELPIVNVVIRVRTGAIFDPPDKVGLSSLAGTVMRTGGTHTIPGDELDARLEAIAGSLEVTIGEDSGSVSLSVLKEHLDTGLEYLADLLRNPEFPEDKIALAKLQMRSAIARRNDHPSGIAAREFAKLIYGADHPLGRHTEYRTIDAITREDVVAFHRRFFHPDLMIVGAWGDFETGAMVEKLRSRFGDLPASHEKVNLELPVTARAERGVYHIEKGDVTQTTIRMGTTGLRMDDPAYFPLTVWYEILSGGFAGRLFVKVRTQLGLAYSVGAGPGAGFLNPGLMVASAGTKSESTVQAIRAILEEIQRMRDGEFTEAEIRSAKERLINSFIFNFDTRAEIVARQVAYEYYGYPVDFLQRSYEGIQKVTKDQIIAAAQKWVDPERFVILTVGRSADFGEPLTALGRGEPELIDITIPS
ncbi:MAG: M16 family metallopeptidase [bacterium JZ-2024 1]